MIGRSFEALRYFKFSQQRDDDKTQSRHEGLQVDLPACRTLHWTRSEDFLRFLSCPNLQIFCFWRHWVEDEAPRNSLINFLSNCSCLEKLEIDIPKKPWWADSLVQFVLRDARERGLWQDIRKAKVRVMFYGSSCGVADHFFSEVVGQQQHYEKWWERVAVTNESTEWVKIRATR